MASTETAQGPCRILFRTKEGVELYDVPQYGGKNSTESKKKEGRVLAKGESTSHVFSPRGDRVLIHLPSQGVIMRRVGAGGDTEDDDTSTAPFLADSQRVQLMTYSPRGTYILTWERPSKVDGDAQPPGNLKIWEGSTGKLLHALFLKMIKKECWPNVQWTHDEAYAFHLRTNELHVYEGHAFFADADAVKFQSKIRCAGISSFSLPTTVHSSVLIAPGKYLLQTFVAETKGKPARVSMLRYPDCLGRADNPSSGNALVSKSFYQAEEVTVKWSPKGDSSLVMTHTSVDTSGESYYGSTNLYLLLSDTAVVSKVPNEGETVAVPLPSGNGPVLDVSWMPNPTKPPRFALISGRMPAMASLHHGTTAEPTFLFGNAHRNTISWADHGRFVGITGFGNLAGKMDFWDNNKLKKIPMFDPVSGAPLPLPDGGITASCAVGYGWSPDSRMFFISTTTPRMNVDNGVRLFRYNGFDITNQAPWDNARYSPDRLLAAAFVPAPWGSYPDRAQSPPPKRVEGATVPGAATATTTPAPVTAAPGRYVPPAARRAGGGGMSLAERMRKEREGSTTGATKVVSKSSVVGASVSKKPTVVGMAPAEQGKSKNALKKEKARMAKLKAEEEERMRKEQEAAAAAAAPVDPKKRSKKISKLLKQIDELKSKDPSTLNDDQKSKLSSEEELRKELAGLSV
eukprot:scaffold244006_cov50-Attheya_sp.AAC.2